MKSWTLSDELQARPDLAAAVEKLRPVLEQRIGPRFAPVVTAAWRVSDDGRGLVVRLADPDWRAGVETELTPADLADPRETRWLLHRLWTDVLAKGSHVLIGRMFESDDTEEVGDDVDGAGPGVAEHGRQARGVDRGTDPA